VNEKNADGDTPMLYIAKQGHRKYPPAEIPLTLIKAGADLEATNKSGQTPLQVSLMSGWQDIASLLIDNGADSTKVAEIKGRITCPDCKRVLASYKL
jgi:ankyrin repeat protein